MRPLIICFNCLIILFSCSEINGQEEQIQEITYRTMTRGSQKEVVVTANQLRAQASGVLSFQNTEELSADQWNNYLEKCKSIQLATLDDLYASVENQGVDRGAAAELIIVTDQGEYHSPLFDENNPPQELEPLLALLKPHLVVQE
jgi:endonuclease III